MFNLMISVRFYEKGDRVCTPAGRGTVIETETRPSLGTANSAMIDREVMVKLDHPERGRSQMEIDATLFILLDENDEVV